MRIFGKGKIILRTIDMASIQQTNTQTDKHALNKK